MRFYRRRSTHIPQIVGRLRDAIGRAKDPETAKAIRAVSDAFDAVAVELQQYLATLQASNDGGLPPGGAVKDDGTIASGGAIQPVSAAPSSPGTPSGGWVPVDHRHRALVGPAVDLTRAATAEGVSELLARADHPHQMLIQAEGDGVDLGNVSAVNVVGPGLDVQVEPNLDGSLLTGLYGHWPFDEVSGTRRCAIGSAPNLTETGGTVPSAPGKFGNAISGTEADTFDLGAIGASIPMSGGVTVELWFRWPTSPSVFPDSMLTIGPIASNTFIHIFRFYDSNFLAVGYRWGVAAGDSVSLPTPRPGPLAEDEWHLLVVTYDPTTGLFTGRVDGGCATGYVYSPPAGVGNPALKLSATVPAASLAAANAVTLTTLSFMKAFNGNYKNFEGLIDAPTIWTRCLTDAEVERRWLNFRATISYSPPYGSCWGNEIAWSQVAAVQNTWYAINDTDMSDGKLLDVAHDGSGKLTVTYAGKYLITYAVSLTSGAGVHIQSGIFVNGSIQNDGISRIDVLGAANYYEMSGTAIVELTAGQYVQIAVRTTDAGTPTLEVDHLSYTILYVGE